MDGQVICHGDKRTMDTLEKKDGAARRGKYMRGVCYDKRIRKFVAEIRIGGRRVYLGAFDTEEDAGAAHALARHDNPIRRGGVGGGPTFQEAYDAFLAQHAEDTGVPVGVVQEGAEFVAPNGQRYFMVKMDNVPHPHRERVKWKYYRWHSQCSECGADFITSTRCGQKVLAGMTRNCWKHRKAGSRLEEPTAHLAALKAVRAAREAARVEDEDDAEATKIMYQKSLVPGTTRADNRRNYQEALAAIKARRAAAKTSAGDLV